MFGFRSVVFAISLIFFCFSGLLKNLFGGEIYPFFDFMLFHELPTTVEEFELLKLDPASGGFRELKLNEDIVTAYPANGYRNLVQQYGRLFKSENPEEARVRKIIIGWHLKNKDDSIYFLAKTRYRPIERAQSGKIIDRQILFDPRARGGAQ